MTGTIIEQLKNDILQHIRNKNLNDLKTFILNYKVNLKEIDKYGYEDLLYYAIKNDNSKDLIRYIWKESEYRKVNYTISSNSSTPLGLAVARNNFEVADVLCDEYHADINYGEGDNRCLPFIYRNDLSYKPKQIDYLVKRGYSFYDMPERIIKGMVASFQNDLLKKIWYSCIYTNDFILQTLERRNELRYCTRSQWERYLKEEKQKLRVSDEVYETVFIHKNWEALQLFLNHDGRDQKLTIFDMIEENEVMEKAIDRQDLGTIQAISNFGYALNYKCFNFEDLIMKSYSKVNKEIWKILIKSSVLSYQEKEERLIEGFNYNLRKSRILEDRPLPVLPNEDVDVDVDVTESSRTFPLDSHPKMIDAFSAVEDDFEDTEENDITNNMVIKQEDGLNYKIKPVASETLGTSTNPSNPDTNLSNPPHPTKNALRNSKERRSYLDYLRSSKEESFITEGDLSRDFIMDESPIISSAVYKNFLGESPFIHEPSQNFIDDDSKLAFPRMNPDRDPQKDSAPLPTIEFPRVNSDSTISSPALAFDKINPTHLTVPTYPTTTTMGTSTTTTTTTSTTVTTTTPSPPSPSPRHDPPRYSMGVASPSLAFDRIHQNIIIASPPMEYQKGKNYYLYLIQEVIKESRYNSSCLLNMAIRLHHEPLIKYLIEGDQNFKPRINLNAKDINGNYPLITFIRSDRCSHLHLLLYLLEKGADPNVRDGNGYTPLMLSIQKEFEMGENIPDSFVKILIEHGADVNEKDANGNSLLSLAVQKNSIRMVDCFLEHGCSMTEKDASGNYPLMVAISQNQYDMVKLFMRYGKKHHQLKNFALRDTNGNTPLTLAYKLRLNAIFKYLLKYLDINDRDAQGKSLLFHALERNDTKVVKYLLQVGAEVNPVDSLGNSPLIYAIKRGSLFLVQKLVEHGANINVKDRSGTPSLIIAYDYQKMDIFKYLVEHNVTMNEPFTENEINSVFFRIIIDKQIATLKYVIKYGANVNCYIGSLRSTPLMYACLYNDMDMVKCLVENNANLNIYNTQGNTALAYAISKHNLEMVNYLIDHGADIYHRNNEGQSIYDVAYENCKHDLLQGQVMNLNDKTKIYQRINYLYHE